MKERKISVLVVDDEEIVRNFFKRLLKGKACDVTAVATGKEAIATAKRRKFDLFFIDILLRDSNGIEIYQKIKKIQPRLDTIMITGEPSQAHLEGLDIQGYLSKPFKIEMILSVLDRVKRAKGYEA